MSQTPLTLISSMATREVLRQLAADFQAATGQAVSTEAGGGVDVAKRVRAGERVDIVVLAHNVIDALIAEGHALPGSRADLVKSGVAVAVKAGAVRPDLGSEEAVKQAVLAAGSLSYSTGPSGTYLEGLFARWGILEQIRGRIVVPPPGVPVGSLVASGGAELGFQQLSELMNLPGIEVAGPLPPSIQTLTIFSGAITTACQTPAAARALLAFLASPTTAPTKQRHGMDAA